MTTVARSARRRALAMQPQAFAMPVQGLDQVVPDIEPALALGVQGSEEALGDEGAICSARRNAWSVPTQIVDGRRRSGIQSRMALGFDRLAQDGLAVARANRCGPATASDHGRSPASTAPPGPSPPRRTALPRDGYRPRSCRARHRRRSCQTEVARQSARSPSQGRRAPASLFRRSLGLELAPRQIRAATAPCRSRRHCRPAPDRSARRGRPRRGIAFAWMQVGQTDRWRIPGKRGGLLQLAQGVALVSRCRARR